MKKSWMIILTFIISGAVTGSGTHYFVSQQTSKEKNDLKEKITLLDQESAALSAQVDTLTKEMATKNAAAAELEKTYKDWKTLDLTLTGGTVKYPNQWTITSSSDESYSTQFKGYDINKDNTTKLYRGSILEYNVDEWLKGAAEGEGYVMTKEKRAALLQTAKKLYDAGKLTEELKTELNQYGVEFTTYSATDRVYVTYLISNDGKAKGVSMFNTHGQDINLTTEYCTFLYNKEKNTVLYSWYTIKGSEMDKLREQYGDYSSENIESIDKKVHSDFSNLIAASKRKDLSFGSDLDLIDNVMKSWTY